MIYEAGVGQAPGTEGLSLVLPESQAELRQMIAALPGMLWTANPQGLVDFLSPQWQAATGLRMTELLGMGWLDAVHPDDRHVIREQWSVAVQAPHPVMLELRLCQKHGVARWFCLRATPIFDNHGGIHGWFGLCVDIDDFKRTQQELLDSERRYTVLFENKINGVVQLRALYDEEGHTQDLRIERINQAYTRIIGLTPAQVEGRLLSEVFPGIRNSEPDYITLYGRLARESGEASFETDFLFSGKWLRVYAYSALHGECIAIFADITAQKQIERALRESEERLKLIIDHLAEGLIVFSPDGKSLQWNKKALALHGYKQHDERLAMAEEIRQDYEMLSPEGRRLSFEEWPVPRLLRGEEVRDVEAILFNKREHWLRDLSFGGVLVRAPDGQPLMGLLTIRDITERRQAERARASAERRLQLAVDIANLGSWEWDIAEQSVIFSPQWKRLLGYAEHEIPDRLDEWAIRLHKDDSEKAMSALKDFVAHPAGTFQSEYRMRHRDGEYRWMLSRAIAELDDEGQAIRLVGTMLDVTYQKQHEQKVREAAQHDPLTGLPNRALIYEYSSHLLAAADRKHSRGALLFVDLDRFKQVNDLHGHEIGDRLLKEVASRMVACVRQEDLIGRLGGDEFVIVLPYLDRGYTAPTVARHVIDALTMPFHIAGLELSISASVGISFYPVHGTEIDTLLHRADLAMYHAKETGRGKYQVYTSELGSRIDASASIEARIKQGLSGDGLVLHYQPVIDVDSGRVVAAEALLRLRSTDGEFVGPASFIPVAESAGMIAQLGDWVATEVCRQLLAWSADGMPPIRIAMNISALQFRQRGFASRLLSIIRRHHVDPGCLQIEVTENSLADRIDDAMETLSELHSAGIQVALDDLGTGSSSLSSISHLPLDKLKIDQVFVNKLRHDPASRAVAEAVISMGKALQLDLVGEGIESEETLAYLRSHGCEQAQGNLFSHPLPAAEFTRWYRERGSGAHAYASRPH